MKQVFLTLLLIAGLALSSEARTLTAVANGPWESNSTWSPAGVPGNNDIVYIPLGKTVTVNSNHNESSSQMQVRVGGVLDFVGGGSKLWIAAQSLVYVYPAGKITANQNSQVIKIGGTTVMNGSNSGTTITGPSVATSTNSTNNLSASNTPSGFLPYSPSALPVTFIAFTATRQGGDVLVQWSTATEENADRFDVEVSNDGRNWSPLGSVPAAGNSFDLRQYSFTARSQGGTLQFRVKQVDLDGKYTYTAIRTVKGAIDGSVKMTAASGRLVLNFGAQLNNATVRILNLNGQVLQEQKMSTAFGQVLLPTAQKGLCIVAVLSENEIAATQKVVL